MPTALRVVFVIALINFASFFVIAVTNGGDAINGNREGDRYYIMEHGRYTEVTPQFFAYSRIHAVSVWVTHGIAGVGVVLWLLSRSKLGQE
jgi:hypothetical protein